MGRQIRMRAYHETLASNDELRLRLLGRKEKLPPCAGGNQTGGPLIVLLLLLLAAVDHCWMLVTQREGEGRTTSCFLRALQDQEVQN